MVIRVVIISPQGMTRVPISPQVHPSRIAVLVLAVVVTVDVVLIDASVPVIPIGVPVTIVVD